MKRPGKDFGTLMDILRKTGMNPESLKGFSSRGKVETFEWSGRVWYRISDVFEIIREMGVKRKSDHFLIYGANNNAMTELLPGEGRRLERGC